MDPWVRLTYAPYMLSRLHHEALSGMPMLTWAGVQAASRSQVRSGSFFCVVPLHAGL